MVVVKIEKSKGKRQEVEYKSATPVVGYSQLPEPGGMLDQPVWMMAVFSEFRNGENAAAAKRLK